METQKLSTAKRSEFDSYTEVDEDKPPGIEKMEFFRLCHHLQINFAAKKIQF